MSNGSQRATKQRRRGIRGWRLWAFRLLTAAAAPVMFLVLTEFALRAAGVGYCPRVAVKQRVGDVEAYFDNPDFSRRFFPPALSRDLPTFSFPSLKAPGTCRIFVLGSSAAMGVPEPAYSFGRILDHMLRLRHPRRSFEVITTAMTAINSHVILEIAKDCARWQPDFFVVYMGNNEVVGPYGAGTVFAPALDNLAAIRTGIWVRGTRLGQLCHQLLDRSVQADSPAKNWRGMEMFLDKQVPYDSPELEVVYRHFERNLSDLCRVCRQAGAEVALCTVGCNLKDCAPFGSLHKKGLSESELQRWRRLYEDGIAQEAAGRYGDAGNAYLAAAKIDSAYADLRFRLGRCRWRQGDFARAKSEYVAARDYDTLRFRPHSRINEIIRSVAKANSMQSVQLVDCDAAFQRQSPENTPGEELFWEHVHLKFAGAYLLARSVLEAIEAKLPPTDGAAPPVVASEAECARRLAFTDWDRHRLTAFVLQAFLARPPFTGQLDHEDQMKRLAKQVQELAAATRPDNFQPTLQAYGQAISLSPADWRIRCLLAQFLVSAGQHVEAERQYRFVLQGMPEYHAPAVYDGLCKALAGQGRHDEAIDIRRQMVRRKPHLVLVHLQLAQALQNRGDADEAIEHYRAAIELEPRLSVASENLATELSLVGEFDEAQRVLERAMEANSDLLPGLHRTAAQVLLRRGKPREAVAELQQALRIDPDYAPARELLKAAAARWGGTAPK